MGDVPIVDSYIYNRNIGTLVSVQKKHHFF